MTCSNETVFKNVRLVCRLRRSSGQSPSGSPSSESASNTGVPFQPTSTPNDVPGLDVEGLPVSTPSHAATNPIHYFIMKSLSRDELAWSVANNVWVTQSHNECALNEAYTVTFSQ